MNKHEEAYLNYLDTRNIILVGNYVNCRTKIEHECAYGHTWIVNPGALKGNNSGCPECSRKSQSLQNYTSRVPDNIEVLDEYTSNKVALRHRCKTCNTVWSTIPKNILEGTNCPSCAKSGFKRNQNALLYYVKITDKQGLFYYKIGVTNRTIKERYRLDHDKSIVVLYSKILMGEDAENIETKVLNENKEHTANVNNFLKSGGNTELFKKDILKELLKCIN